MFSLLVLGTAVWTLTSAHPVMMKQAYGTTCFLNALDEFTCIGNNQYGQLGLGHYDNIGDSDDETGDNLPVIDLGDDLTVVNFTVGAGFVCVVRSDAKVVCWGKLSLGANGMSMTDAETHSDPITANISDTGSITPVSVHGGLYNVFIIDTEGDVYGWGAGFYGGLGYGAMTSRVGPEFMGDNLVKIDLGTGRTAVDVGSSYYHTCALLDDDTIKCWGKAGITGKDDNVSYGGAANTMGDNNPIVDFGSGFIPVEFGMVKQGTCARSTLGEVRCWGLNEYSNLGVNAYAIRVPNGDPVNLGTGRTAVHLATGYEHVCVIRDNDDVVCWGNGQYYNLLNEAIYTVGKSDTEMGDGLVPYDGGYAGNARSITCGYMTTCVQFTSDKVKCYGSNNDGTLGYGTSATVGADLSAVNYVQFRGFVDEPDPTDSPTVSPTMSPTASPSSSPTVSPTDSPTVSPTATPTNLPTEVPSVSPTVASPDASECTIVITAESDSDFTWDLTDSEGDEEIASGEFDGSSITLIGEVSESYILFLSGSTIPSGTITISIDGDEEVIVLDGTMSVDTEITDVTCAGVASATTGSSGSSDICLNLAILLSLFLI